MEMEGSGRCYFCFDRIKSINDVIYGDGKKIYEDIYECSKKYLQDEAYVDSFDWRGPRGVSSPLCTNCFNSAQKIHGTSQDLERLEEILKELIALFKVEVKNRNSKNLNQKSTQVLIPKHSKNVDPPFGGHSEDGEDNNVNNGGLQLQTEECDYDCFQDKEFDEVAVKSEEETNVVPLKEEDSFLTNEIEFPEILPCNNSGQQMPLDNETEDHPSDYILSSHNHVDETLPRIVLEKLTFGPNGPLIETQIVRKRKSTITTSAKQKDWSTDYVPPKKRNAVVSHESEIPIRVKKEKKNLDCSIYEKLFDLEADISKHKLVHSDEDARPFKCPVCGKGFNSKRCVRQHENRHDKNSSYECETCGKVFGNIYGLTYHLKSHEKKPIFNCLQCGKRFKCQTSLLNHEAVHDETIYSCRICLKEFKSKKGLNSHKTLAHRQEDIQRVPCSICGKLCSKLYLPYHEAAHVKKPRETSLCSVCGNAYSQRYFARHVRSCQKGLAPRKTSVPLKNVLLGLKAEKACKTVIIKSEDGLEPKSIHTCNICDKNFSSPAQVKLHARSHTGEKPFPCDVCGYRFARETHLKIHLKSHAGEKSFKCDICGASFVQNGHLKLHKFTHTGEKPYNCSYCEKSFSQAGTLKTHERIHTGEKPYICTFCGKSFSDKSGWRKHEKKHK